MSEIYKGVVEDVNDPLKTCRVRVRVFGLHSDDKNLIPTEALPWATVMMPVTSASMSGIGMSPSGLLPGSWVSVQFSDDDCQYPVVIGSLHGIPSDIRGQVAADEDLEFTDSEAESENTLKDGSGNVVKDGSGEPIKTTPPTDVTPRNGKVVPSELGSISSKYESNGNPGTINKYSSGSDLGGASYGAYQFASYLKAEATPTRSTVTASQIKNSPIQMYIRASAFGSEFAGLSPATPEFDAKWKAVASANKAAFLADQHKYIERNYYQVAASKLPSSITNRGKAIHEAIWSMAVQLGPGGCANKFKSVLGNLDPSVCDDKAITLLYDSRIATVKTDFKSSPGLWAGLTNRFTSEKAALIALAKTYETGECGEVQQVPEDKVVYKEDGEKEVVTETKTVATSRTKGDRGFTDPSKKYPLYYNEPDSHRLARGVLTGTIVETKRANVIRSKEAGSGLISEPVTQYNTKYPYNKVLASESGHIIEIDDTPGHERVQIYHKSGSFVEFYPDGQVVSKSKGDRTAVINSNDNTIILSNENTHVSGDSNKTVAGNIKLVVYGNVDTEVNGNVTLSVDGNCKVTAARIDLN